MAFFLIVLLVTCDTFIRQLILVNSPLLRQVATVTLGWPMLAAKHVAGVGIVVEAYFLPALIGMASLALYPIAAIVGFFLINLLVALVALFRCVLKFFSDMAVYALYIHMLSQQPKVGFVMIETGRFPVFLNVTFHTIATQPSLVFIILLVASIAIGRRLPESCLVPVTILALHFFF